MGANRGFATRPRWENEKSYSPHPGRRASGPVQLVIPLEVDQGGEDVEDNKLSLYFICIGLVLLGINLVKEGNVHFC